MQKVDLSTVGSRTSEIPLNPEYQLFPKWIRHVTALPIPYSVVYFSFFPAEVELLRALRSSIRGYSHL